MEHPLILRLRDGIREGIQEGIRKGIVIIRKGIVIQ